MKTITVIVAVCLLLAGCASGFAKFYQGAPNGSAVPHYDASYAPAGGPRLIASSDMKEDVQRMEQKGFKPFGESSFYGPENRSNIDQLRAQAKKVGAQVVLYSTSYRDTLNGAVPIVTPNNTTSYTNGSATAYGPAGTVNAYGTATTTTYGTQTTIVPYSVSRSNFDAVYFVKVKSRLGIITASLTDDERQQLQTNSALKIRIVIEDSPAFLADILPGDYVLSINGDKVSSPEKFGEETKRFDGQPVTLILSRDGQTIQKDVVENQLPD